MARPLRIQFPGAFYHVMSRGNEQKSLFKSQADRQKFLTYLDSAVVRYGAVIHSWCLMDNHYHLLIETPKGNLSQIMRHINGAYTTYFNIKRKRAGHLFQGRYKALLVETDSYAGELSRYLHLNPVQAGLVERPEEYPWSSYRSYIGQAQIPAWLTTEFVLAYFGGPAKGKKLYRQFVEAAFIGEYESPLQAAVASTLLGGADFVRRVSETLLLENQDLRNVPSARELTRRPLMDDIIERIEAELGEGTLQKNIGIYCCQKYSGAKLKEIGERYGISDSAVSQASRRLVLKAEKDPELRKMISRMDKLWKKSGVKT